MSDRRSLMGWVPWRGGDVLRGIVLVVSGSLVFLLVASLLRSGDVIPGGLVIPLFAVCVGGLMLLATITFGVAKYSVGMGSLGFRAPQVSHGFLLPWAVLIASLTFTSLYITVVTHIGWASLAPSEEALPDIGQGLPRLLNVLALGVWAPLSEEVFFRGFVLPPLVPRFGVWGALAITSALFALGHGLVAVMIPIFVSGLLLGWLYMRTGSIWPSIMAHSAQNLIVVTLAG